MLADARGRRARANGGADDERRCVAAAASRCAALVEEDEDRRARQPQQRLPTVRRSQASPTATEQSCIEWQRSGTTSEKSGSARARDPSASCASGTIRSPALRGSSTIVLEVREGVVLLRVAAATSRRGSRAYGSPSAYVFQVCPAASSVSARLRAAIVQSVQLVVIPCVEPDTSAR